MRVRENPEKNYVYSSFFAIIKAKEMHFSQLYFGKELSIFRTDLLSIIKNLNTVFTAIGILHTENLKMGKITM
jgi:hypothetical protein